MNLAQLKKLFEQAGAVKLYAKSLAENDNSKNQVYFGPDFQALNIFPNLGVIANDTSKNPIFKAKVHFGWLQLNGSVAAAPHAQLILYPQYPEVRFSGFLKGCAAPPSALMAGRMHGRILFLAITSDRQVLGFVVSGRDEVAAEFNAARLKASDGVFVEIGTARTSGVMDARAKLLTELGRINRLQWIDSKQLDASGNIRDCSAAHCGGFTLEAELNIPKNSVSEPDFLGWEVKQHAVTSFTRADSGAAITLMTPEPTGGFYKERGVEQFIRKFGYPDKNHVPDRLNFGGIHRSGRRQPSTGLTMLITGYDVDRRKITTADGVIALISDEGEVAAEWAFSGLLEHWSRKHARAVYVPSMCRKEPRRQYAYGSRVRLAQQTDGLRFLKALAEGGVYYDPGIKLEHASSVNPALKRRSQFRVASKDIACLYETVEAVEV